MKGFEEEELEAKALHSHEHVVELKSADVQFGISSAWQEAGTFVQPLDDEDDERGIH